jgi:hypothetical protein
MRHRVPLFCLTAGSRASRFHHCRGDCRARQRGERSRGRGARHPRRSASFHARSVGSPGRLRRLGRGRTGIPGDELAGSRG